MAQVNWQRDGGGKRALLKDKLLGTSSQNLAEPKMLWCASDILSHALVAHKSSPSQRGHQCLPLSCYVALFLSHALVAHKSSPSQRGHQRLPLLPCTGRSQELALTERAPAFTPFAMHWSLTRARPHREGTSLAPSAIREPVAWGAHQSSPRGAPWGVCAS